MSNWKYDVDHHITVFDGIAINIAQKREAMDAEGLMATYDTILFSTRCPECGKFLEWIDDDKDCGGAYLYASCCETHWEARPQVIVISKES